MSKYKDTITGDIIRFDCKYKFYNYRMQGRVLSVDKDVVSVKIEKAWLEIVGKWDIDWKCELLGKEMKISKNKIKMNYRIDRGEHE